MLVETSVPTCLKSDKQINAKCPILVQHSPLILSVKMGLITKVAKASTKRAWTRFLDKVGSRFVARMADTSSDAPNAFHEPKRDIYAQMAEDEKKPKTG
jgi:hypothetical protein